MDEIERWVAALVTSIPTEDAEAEERAWSSLEQRLRSEQPGRPLGPKPAVQRAPWARMGLRALIAASLSLAVLVGGAVLPSELGGPVAASATLRLLAATAREQPGSVIPRGSFVYRSIRRHTLGGGSSLVGGEWTYRVDSLIESWRSADGSGRIVTTYGTPTFLSRAHEDAWIAAGRPQLVPPDPQVEDFSPGTFPALDLSGLPTETGALRRALASGAYGAPPGGSLGTLDLVAELLAEQLVPPASRAALFELAAQLEGIEALGTVKDPLGREGLGVRLGSGERAVTMIVDPTTSELLAQIDERSIDGSIRATWRAFSPSMVVGSTGGS